MDSEGRFILGWIVSRVLPVMAFILAGAALLLALKLDTENQILRQSVRTLQDIEIGRQTARVDKLVKDTKEDSSGFSRVETAFGPMPKRFGR